MLKDSLLKYSLTETYGIPVNEHRATFAFEPISNFSGMVGSFYFSDECMHNSLPDGDEMDINKLGGYAETMLPSYKPEWPFLVPPHQRYSARIGWRVTSVTPNQMIEVLLYVYNQDLSDRFVFKPIGFVRTEKPYHFRLGRLANMYFAEIFAAGHSLNQTPLEAHIGGLPRYKSTVNALGYKLFPYFGGNNPAPNSMEIGFYGRPVKQIK
jgi:hypothetical protein